MENYREHYRKWIGKNPKICQINLWWLKGGWNFMTLGGDILFENEVNQRKLWPSYDFSCILMITLKMQNYVFCLNKSSV